MKRLVVIALLGLSSVALAAPTQAQLQKERAETAARVYATTIALFKAGRATTDAVYHWSIHWLESDLDSVKTKQPLADHAKRMLELETDATKMKDAGTLGVADAEGAKYFRIEADLWVARGKR